MKKLIRFTINQDVQELLGGIAYNENGEGFFNPSFISQLFFEKDVIYFTLGVPMSHSGVDVNFKFSDEGMGEYHRMKRELSEILS